MTSAVFRSILRTRRLRPPRPTGKRNLNHGELRPVLRSVAEGGVATLASVAVDLRSYLDHLASIDPDGLDPTGAKVFWINLYNAGAGTPVPRPSFGSPAHSTVPSSPSPAKPCP